MLKADNLTTILGHCHVIWEPKFLEPCGHLGPVMGLNYFFLLLLEIWIGLICIASHWKNLTSERVEETGAKTGMMRKREFVYFLM